MKKQERCRSCGGTYSTESDNGVRYFHACPPYSEAEGMAGQERKDKRDENIVVDERGIALGIKSEGRGTDEIE